LILEALGRFAEPVVPNAEIEIVASVGHYPKPEHPAATNATIAAFSSE